MTARLEIPDAAQRDDLAVFCARAVRLDAGVAIRLRAEGGPDGPGRVEVWAPTPFDALVTRTVHGSVHPGDVTVAGSDLLAALSVVGGPTVDPGRPCDERWHSALPTDRGWTVLDDVPAAELDGLAERGIQAARDGDPSGRPSPALLDQVVLTVRPPDDAGRGDRGEARVPMRCVFALAGMGFLEGGDADRPPADVPRGSSGALRAAVVGVSTGGSAGHDWLRLDAFGGAVVRRRRPSLVLTPV